MNKFKEIFQIKNIEIAGHSQKKDLSFKFDIKRMNRNISYINEYRNNLTNYFIDDDLINNKIINRIKRRGRLFTKNDFFCPSIYETKKSWKHNSKRTSQFKLKKN